MSRPRLAPIAAIAIACAACLPTGPDEYEGPAYALTPGAGYADAGSALGVADAGTPAFDGATNTAPIVPPAPTGVPSDASTPTSSDAGPLAPDAGIGGGGGGGGAELTSCKFSATTTKPAFTAGRSYSAYVLAIWIENGSGALVRTLDYFAASRARYLLTYAKARGTGTVDATSGASISNLNPMSQEASWDLADRTGARVPDGNYMIRIESTSGNGQGPVLDVPFTIGGATPVDVTAGDTANVSGVRFTCN